ncbi:PadR family transcriptional regulator [Thermosipho ferrireducens]|uniref:PadR family transcriptional regulator n=1 Tax=Thermosipho ferrireducens TaxID=2571116 RepID=A0ABX7S777_9BACT|nr:PadR family transcriptional regulator [Thermosipho ferrireducens]QTA38454.1 PadR family transcriptional regulator [Thermosipho ferrireducens]
MPGGFGRGGRRGFGQGGVLAAMLLLLLKEKPGHGYEIIQRLNELNFYRFQHDPGVIYRMLRKMEMNGFITYSLQEGEGPIRKVYRITSIGEMFLKEMAKEIKELSKLFSKFLEEYERLSKNKEAEK